MVDVLTDRQRRLCMSRIRGKDTKPEMIVRKLLHSQGYRYRLHVRKLPGSPDIVFVARRKVIFVHGCFWHRHNCRYGSVVPQTHPQFWAGKLEKNRLRDRKNRAELRKLGWEVMTVWECETRTLEKLRRLTEKLVKYLGS